MPRQAEGRPGLWKRLALRLADVDQQIRGDRWRPLVRQIYRVLAPFYDWGAQRLMPDYQDAAIHLLVELAARDGDRLLDLGCGTGMVTVPAAERGAHAVGIDMTTAMLRQLQQKQQQGRPALVRGDVRFLPFAPKSFDLVTTSFMLLHLTADEKQRTLAEARRVLAAKGRFGALTGREETTATYPKPEAWRNWLEAAGFCGIRILGWSDAYRLVLARTPAY